MPAAAPPPADPVRLGRGICGVLDDALRREWVVADGTGSFATGTVAGGLTRRYHALLVAATEPPMGRMVAVAGMSEAVLGAGAETLLLHTQEWASGTVAPRGHELIESFELDGLVPTWRYALPGALMEKRVWMARGAAASTTYVTYTLVRAVAGLSLRLQLRPLCTWRDYHTLARAGDEPSVDVLPSGDGLRLQFGGAAPAYVVRATAPVQVDGGGTWYRDLHLRVETERGLDDVQDLFAAGALTMPLVGGETVAVCISLDPAADPAGAQRSLQSERARAAAVAARSPLHEAPPWINRLVLAADQFIASRAGLETVLAGFPWFGDWGRDTMISLPGLALATGRPEVAAGLLRGFARYVRDGLLPNRFPDFGEQSKDNTADATLWYVEAIRAYAGETGDDALVRELWPVLSDIVVHHVAGTRHGIGVDPADGLLRAGEPGVQLTWMDAMVDGWVVTPRMGKPVEISALWHNLLCAVDDWQSRLSLPPMPVDVAALRAQVAAGFDRYWNAADGYLFDVLDGPEGDDAAVRPNAIIAVALPHTPIAVERLRQVVQRAERDLVTSMGLRSLAPDQPGYTPHYRGDLHLRDGAYHQGTVWPWPLGSFVLAHLRAFGDRDAARSFLQPLADHLSDAGMGGVSEIADASPPHTPRGCPWQAWSVAETLRAWRALQQA